MTKQQAGRLGGRPRALTIEDIRQQQPLEAQNKKGVKDTPSELPDSLIELRRLYLHRQVEAGNAKQNSGQGNLPGVSLPGRSVGN